MRVSALLKPFLVIPKFVDLLVEPAVHERGVDLYAGEWHMRITEVLASLGADACRQTWRPLLEAFVGASRRPSQEAAVRLSQCLASAVHESDGHPVDNWLMLAVATPDVLLARLAAVPGQRSADALDPALTATYEQAL